MAQVLVILNQIIDALQEIRKMLWNSFSPKQKHETICKDFQHAGLKNIDIKPMTKSLQRSIFHRFIFRSNLNFNDYLNSFPEF